MSRFDPGILLLVLLAGAAILFTELGTASFYGDEAIYAQLARESAEGSWLPLTFNGNHTFSKPPLRILLTAALFRTLGSSRGASSSTWSWGMLRAQDIPR